MRTTPGTVRDTEPRTRSVPSAATVLRKRRSAAIKKLKLGALLKKGLAVTATCDEGCELTAVLTRSVKRKGGRPKMLNAGQAAARPEGMRASAAARRAAKAQVLGRGGGRLTTAGKTKVTVKLTKKARKALKRARKLSATLVVTARDAAGNTGTASKKVTAKR
jgi:hypothetical protein